MSWLRGLLLFSAVIGIGCSTRALDPADPTGSGGAGSLVRDSGTDGGPPDGPRPRTDAMSRIDILLPPPEICGNGIVDPGEQCDDGNKAAGDGCSTLCQIECYWNCGTCGASTCIVGSCGDGVLGPGEACDDGNTRKGDGCPSDCATIESGWYCPVPGRPCVPACGDGFVVGPETCDDRNTIAGDGCSDICLIEPTTASCGDGMIEGAEQCDDGAANTGTTYGSGCTAQCRFAAYCGDGVVNGPEGCDDGSFGNNVTYGNMRGCTATCTVPHYCGDGVVDSNYGEQCDFGSTNGKGASVCTTDCKVLLI